DPDRLTASNQLPGDTRLVNELRGYAGEQAIVVTGCSDERADGAGPVSDAQSWAFQLTMRGFNDVLVVATASPVPGAAETADTREKLFEILRWDGSLSLPAAWTAHHQGSTMLSSTQATEP
ncbi:MAG TPA: hypothetical protein VL068_15190, partial [Microthrixaceae bacterium]|nr:hypothetical protein [Microthrixaceae bacterium]